MIRQKSNYFMIMRFGQLPDCMHFWFNGKMLFKTFDNKAICAFDDIPVSQTFDVASIVAAPYYGAHQRALDEQIKKIKK